MPLLLSREDLSKIPVDAIVDSSDPNPISRTGITYAIHTAAGEGLMRARKQLPNGGRLEEGKPEITDGFDLEAKYVVHLVTPHWVDGNENEEERLAGCYRSALMLADSREDIHSIAFPLLCSGNHLFPLQTAMRIALNTILDFLYDHDLKVCLVLYGDKAFALGEKLFGSFEEKIDDDYIDNVKKIIGKDEVKRERDFHIRIQQQLKSEANSVAGNEKGVDIGKYVHTERQSIYDLIKKHLSVKRMKTSDIYEKSNNDLVIGRYTLSKVKAGKRIKKRTAVAFALALKLNLDEAQELLAKAGFGLDPSDKGDAVVIWQINHGEYSFDQLGTELCEQVGINLKEYGNY